MLKVTGSTSSDVQIPDIDPYADWWNTTFTTLQDIKPNEQTISYKALVTACGEECVDSNRDWVGEMHGLSRWYILVENEPVFVEQPSDKPCVLYCADAMTAHILHAIDVLAPLRNSLRQQQRERCIVSIQRRFKLSFYHPQGVYVKKMGKRWRSAVEALLVDHRKKVKT